MSGGPASGAAQPGRGGPANGGSAQGGPASGAAQPERGGAADCAAPSHRDGALARVALGGALVALVVLFGWFLRTHPAPGPIDRVALFAVGSAAGSPAASALADAGTAWPLCIVVVACALACRRRDPARSLALVAGGGLAVGLGEVVLKPWVHRRLGGGLCYPSGHVTACAVLASSAVLTARGRWRAVVAVPATMLVAAVAVAVVVLGWHYPTDALAGAALGCGSVLLADGLVHRGTAWRGAPVLSEVAAESRGAVTTRTGAQARERARARAAEEGALH